ncbi:Adenine phosphoribosyltransferase [Pseudocercospora fuligena]|uniref:Adenine phosphoribosyltransferase n=1 Tax=Pseudocercospora fuligena TaxID=685502 RepID=A0A8H6RMP8_9PEZI|nr:Adenine phosphoribosyltransferase [Pseudocercospora fuligena]
MATLEQLKDALRKAAVSASKETLTHRHYSDGFELFLQHPGLSNYDTFVVPQLSKSISDVTKTKHSISILEIGPGPKTVLGQLPVALRRKIKKYVAFEPNEISASELERYLQLKQEEDTPFPYMAGKPDIIRVSYNADRDTVPETALHEDEKFDIILFCHSMYGMKPRRSFIEKAVDTLLKREGGSIIVFHRGENLSFDGLACCEGACHPTGRLCIPDEDEEIDKFAAFIAGFRIQDYAIRQQWRSICRNLSHPKDGDSGNLTFSSPEIMVAFNASAATVPELASEMSSLNENRPIKNPEARHSHPAVIMKPTDPGQVQECLRWASKHNLTLTVIGGSHSGQCVADNVVAIDMSAFSQTYIVPREEDTSNATASLIVAGAGCKVGEIIRTAMEAGLTVPLGARPSVGAGLWLQGGIGHLSRLYGLTCDAIAGAVFVESSGQMLCVGEIPDKHMNLPPDIVRREDEAELLWAIRGAGTNIGVLLYVAFKTFAAPSYVVRHWTLSPSGEIDLRSGMMQLSKMARRLSRNASVDLYLFYDAEQLKLGVSSYEVLCAKHAAGVTVQSTSPLTITLRQMLGHEGSAAIANAFELFDKEMYISGMHGGHGGGKTSSFKRCVFFRKIESTKILDMLSAAMDARPTPMCYLHLLQGGGAIADTKPDATAFGCRDWDYACVITGVWQRHEDGSDIARAATQWVYDMVTRLLPLSSGVYGADLGPDPRDAKLAAHAFGPNRQRLARLKHGIDPHNVLAYACPLSKAPPTPKLIVLVTGNHGVGKNYCAEVWSSYLNREGYDTLVSSISDVTKQQYAEATGADLNKLLNDRAYKEQHRQALTAFFQQQVRDRPSLPEEHFMQVVQSRHSSDILLITGMRDDSPVAAFSHLVPHSKLLEIRVTNAEEGAVNPFMCQTLDHTHLNIIGQPEKTTELSAQRLILPYLDHRLQNLSDMVRIIPDFPQPGVEFHDILGITQQPRGLLDCTRLMIHRLPTAHSAIVCCESGGFVFGSALAYQLNLPLALVREAGKLPPPVFEVTRETSFISSKRSGGAEQKRYEMSVNAVPRNGSVIVVDDVLSSGETLIAMLQLLQEAEVPADKITVIVVAEFPVHGGRKRLQERGFRDVKIQSLLVFGCS